MIGNDVLKKRKHDLRKFPFEKIDVLFSYIWKNVIQAQMSSVESEI